MPHCYMHKQTGNQTLIKNRNVNIRLHQGPVYNTYKPNNEKSKANVKLVFTCFTVINIFYLYRLPEILLMSCTVINLNEL